jgi:hypothetical protein
MWSLNRKKTKHVIIIITKGGTFYLAEDLRMSSSVDNALAFPNRLESAHVALSLSMNGISATSSEVKIWLN